MTMMMMPTKVDNEKEDDDNGDARGHPTRMSQPVKKIVHGDAARIANDCSVSEENDETDEEETNRRDMEKQIFRK